MHAIEYMDFSVKTNKATIEKDINRYVERNSDCGGGLYERISWKDRLFENEESAREWIDEHDHSYAQIAVQFKEYAPIVKNASVDKAEERVLTSYKKYTELNEKFHFATSTSKTVTCKNCDSRITKQYLHKNFCPVCRADLRPQTTLDRIASLKESWEKAKASLKEAERDAQKKMKFEEKWLVKIEYHC